VNAGLEVEETLHRCERAFAKAVLHVWMVAKLKRQSGFARKFSQSGMTSRYRDAFTCRTGTSRRLTVP